MTPHAAHLPLPFSRLACVVLLLAISGLWLANIGHRVLQHPDEGRYAEIAREMAVTGDWVTPRLDGLKYFEKPPLQYWITAATFRVFGAHEWTARLWPVLAGMVAALATAWAGLRLGGPLLALGAMAVREQVQHQLQLAPRSHRERLGAQTAQHHRRWAQAAGRAPAPAAARVVPDGRG